MGGLTLHLSLLLNRSFNACLPQPESATHSGRLTLKPMSPTRRSTKGALPSLAKAPAVSKTLVLKTDAMRKTANWRIGNYDDEGILTADQMNLLSKEFELPRVVIKILSKELGHCLDEESFIGIANVDRAKALQLGETTLRSMMRTARQLASEQAHLGRLSQNGVGESSEAADCTRRIEVGRSKMSAMCDTLRNDFAGSRTERAILSHLKAMIDREASSSVIIDAVRQTLATPGAAAIISPRDRRKVMDQHRRFVVETCCYAWIDAGRPVTYTTASDGSGSGQRRGPLLSFLDAVIAMVSDPPAKISGETLRKDIDQFKADRAQPDMMTVPPKYGNQDT